jgi:hypothetical protein
VFCKSLRGPARDVLLSEATGVVAQLAAAVLFVYLRRPLAAAAAA